MNNSLKVGVLFLGRRRPGFDMDWGKRMEERVRQQLKQTHFSIFEPGKRPLTTPPCDAPWPPATLKK